MINFLLESFLHVLLIHMLPDANISCKWVIGLPEYIHRVTHGRNEQLRVMLRYEVFIAAIIAYSHEPGSIWLQLVYQFSRLDHVTQKTVFEIEDMTMSELDQSMTDMMMYIGFVRGST